jgi:syntaxin 5
MGIHSTSQRLQKLAQLAKKTSMFDDPAEEINELATVVKHDIQALNQAISDLQTFSAGGPNKQSTEHSHTVIDNLRSRLKDATKEFKDVLTLRTDNLKVHQERKSIFTSDTDSKPALFAQPGATFLPPPSRHTFGASSSSQFPPQENGHQEMISGWNNSSSSYSQQQQQQQQQTVALQDSYLTSRQEALHQVESTIVELGNIFQQLAHMVHEQGEMTMRIDENVDETLSNVEAGQAQLLKYLNAISSNRWLMLKVFGVIMIAMIFFLLFVA